MKKLLMIALLSIGVYNMNAQCDCKGTTTTTEYWNNTHTTWYATMEYTIDLQKNVCMSGFTWNPAIYGGDYVWQAFAARMLQDGTANSFTVPASCWSSVSTKVGCGEGTCTISQWTPCVPGCCHFTNLLADIQYLLSMGNGQQEDCSPNCHSICP